MTKGALVISLDFEGLWGAIGSKDKIEFEKRVSHINEYVSRLLNLFQKYNIHATWATVGALLCEDKGEALQYLDKDVVYRKWDISMKKFISQIDETAFNQEYKYFNSRSVLLVAQNNTQELGSHTFSHLYTMEQGVNEEMFCQDIDSQDEIVLNKLGKKCTSVVFPRNMVKKEYLVFLKNRGYTAFRGRQDPFIKRKCTERNRIIDFLDAYLPIRNDLCYSMDSIQTQEGLKNIKASMYYRTWSKTFQLFEGLKTVRIKLEMRRAAKKGLVFHLWWHPHNMASNMEVNFKRLEKILFYYSKLQKKYGYMSLSMSEVVDMINSKETC